MNELTSTPHADWIGFLVIFGFCIHTLSCILIIIAIKYCPKWFLTGWVSLAVATILVFIRRAGWAYSMIIAGFLRPFFLWEYAIYVLISFCWGVCGLQMILHGREHGDTMTHTSGSVTQSYKHSTRSPRDDK